MDQSERAWRQAAPPDLNDRIADRIAQRRRGRHAARPSGRHALPPAPGRSRRRSWIKPLLLVVVTAIFVLILRSFVIASFYIPSESMEPTLHGCTGCEPDRVMVDKVGYRFHSVHRQDVVVFSRPAGFVSPDNDLIKRVIGLPGDTVSARGGVIQINGTPLREPYVNPACHGTTDFGPIVVPPGRYFVMGDNRCDSSDSRVFGPITRSSIVGRAFAIVWPLKRLAWL